MTKLNYRSEDVSRQLTLPRGYPKPGMVQALLVIRTTDGTKIEMAGLFDEAKMMKIFGLVKDAELDGHEP